MLDTIITSVLSVLIFVGAYVIDRRHGEAAQLKDEVEELREKLKTAEDERDGWKEKAESNDKLLRAAVERADRLAAMGHGLAEDLAALKAHNPEEIEERIKKIREIRANEERKKQEEKIKELFDLCLLNAQLNVLAGTPVPIAAQAMCDRRTAAQYGMLGR